jgi:hypothetical protein
MGGRVLIDELMKDNSQILFIRLIHGEDFAHFWAKGEDHLFMDMI